MHVNVSRQARGKVDALLRTVGTEHEVAWYYIGGLRKQDSRIVSIDVADIFVPKQTCSSAHADVDEDALFEVVDWLAQKGLPAEAFVGFGHTHPGSGRDDMRPSGTDLDTFEQLTPITDVETAMLFTIHPHASAMEHRAAYATVYAVTKAFGRLTLPVEFITEEETTYTAWAQHVVDEYVKQRPTVLPMHYYGGHRGKGYAAAGPRRDAFYDDLWDEAEAGNE